MTTTQLAKRLGVAQPRIINLENQLSKNNELLKDLINELETKGITEAEIWLMTNKKDILNETSIKKLHKKMFGSIWKWAGTFRTTERNIGVAPYNI